MHRWPAVTHSRSRMERSPARRAAACTSVRWNEMTGSSVLTAIPACHPPQLSYWDAYDGQAIRIIDGSESAPLHSVAVDAAGSCIVTGGADKLVRVWGYDMGQCEYVGVAHSGCVTRAQVTSEGNRIVSVGSEGGIFIWEHEGVQQAQ